jgi:hypothetical protein
MEAATAAGAPRETPGLKHVLEVPHLVAAPADQLVEDLGPTVQRYLTGSLAPRSSA